MFEGLLEVADVARDICVTLHREGDDGNEAKGKPRVALDDMARVVSAVVAPAYNSLVPFHLLLECVLAARKYETHGACLITSRRALAQLTGSTSMYSIAALVFGYLTARTVAKMGWALVPAVGVCTSLN